MYTRISILHTSLFFKTNSQAYVYFNITLFFTDEYLLFFRKTTAPHFHKFGTFMAFSKLCTVTPPHTQVFCSWRTAHTLQWNSSWESWYLMGKNTFGELLFKIHRSKITSPIPLKINNWEYYYLITYHINTYIHKILHKVHSNERDSHFSWGEGGDDTSPDGYSIYTL